MIGAVTRIDSGNLTLKPDAGGEVTITLLPGVSFRRIAPGETNLQKATTIGVTDIHAGDRVLARGTAPGQAALVVVISQSDITQKQAADRADWEKRGVSGTVAAVSTDTLTLRAPHANRRYANCPIAWGEWSGSALCPRFDPLC